MSPTANVTNPVVIYSLNITVFNGTFKLLVVRTIQLNVFSQAEARSLKECLRMFLRPTVDIAKKKLRPPKTISTRQIEKRLSGYGMNAEYVSHMISQITVKSLIGKKLNSKDKRAARTSSRASGNECTALFARV